MSAESAGAQREVGPSGSALPEPPYYAVVFISRRCAPAQPEDGRDERRRHDEYQVVARRMMEFASGSPGFLGVDSTRGDDGLGITVSYWRDEADIKTWREHMDHAFARRRGRDEWYDSFSVHVARVERSYGFRKPRHTALP